MLRSFEELQAVSTVALRQLPKHVKWVAAVKLLVCFYVCWMELVDGMP